MTRPRWKTIDYGDKKEADAGGMGSASRGDRTAVQQRKSHGAMDR